MSFSEKIITEKTLANHTDRSLLQRKLFDLEPIDNMRVEISFTASDIFSDGSLRVGWLCFVERKQQFFWRKLANITIIKAYCQFKKHIIIQAGGNSPNCRTEKFSKFTILQFVNYSGWNWGKKTV